MNPPSPDTPPDSNADRLVRAESELRESEARYRSLVETAYEGVWVVDRVGATTYVNARLCQMLGYEAPDLIGRAIFDFMPAQSAFEARTLFARRQRGIAELHELVLLHRDGSLLSALMATSPLPARDGSFAGVLAMVTDITDRKRAEQALRESEARFRALYEQAAVGIAVSDRADRFVQANPLFCEMLGYSEAELCALTRVELTHPDDRAEQSKVTAALLSGAVRSTSVEKRYLCKDGTVVWARIGISALHDQAGEPQYLIGVIEDITERRQLELQFRQAQKMEAVGRLAGGIAHDFNNLLTVILSNAAFIAEDLPASSPLRADLGEIHRAANRAAELTKQLLAYSRKQVLQPRLLDVNQTVLGVSAMLRRVIGEDISLETQLDPEPGRVLADPGQLEQVLMNLAVNARDAMPSGGVLRIRTSRVVVHATEERTRPGLRPGRYVSLVVEDTGVGIEPSVQAKIFDPFFTTKAPGAGTGLGLATAYGIVKQSDGFIYVDSVPGEGSRFTVLLPPMHGQIQGVLAPIHAELERGSETILLVEDETALRAAIRRMLEAQGYLVREAATGAEALEIVEQAAGRIDLLLTDVVMPEQSGRALAEQLLARLPRCRVLFMSGYTDDEILRRGLMQPASTFLEKPFTPDRLAAAVREALDAREDEVPA